MPNSFVFDPNRCTGCGACRLACGIENQLPPDRSWRRIETFNTRRHPGASLFHLSLACNHCSEPACMYACPALAYSRDEATGVVILDDGKCIGCRYCAWACPYDAPVFEASRGVMSKCTFCAHRLAEGSKPACAALCPTQALDVADIPTAEITNDIPGFPATRLGPRIRIVPLKATRQLPVMTAPPVKQPAAAPVEPSASDISLRSEWSLALFTLATAGLVAAFASRVLAGVALDPLVFVAGAAVTLGLATLHLGRKLRAWRAILNLRRSWLSREVAAVSAFFALSSAVLLVAPGANGLAGAALLAGLAALFCTDYVYGVFKTFHPLAHSASLLLSGALLASVLSGWAWPAALIGFAKLALYVVRKLSFIESGRPVRPVVSALRAGVGLALPPVLWLLDFQQFHLVIIVAVVIGELVDRCEFYIELARITPRRELATVLQRQIAEPALVGGD
jgi:Fe-S-cluster-containing dehydrogenase component/DMSO reductase anchor subunit